MAKIKKDEDRERRIALEIVVDTHDSEEQAMGWYNYLEDQLRFPFTATCISERAISPLRQGDEVEVVEMTSEDECRHEMFVGIRWEKRPLAVPLSQLKPIAHTDEDTRQAVEDWHYWVKRGYEL
jgi:hypothetical protein